jgi:hypothetical protein
MPQQHKWFIYNDLQFHSKKSDRIAAGTTYKGRREDIMQTATIDQTISEIIYGTQVEGFRPSCCEKDAWLVIDWMLHNKLPVDFHKLNPLQICRQAMHANQVKTDRYSRTAA